MRLPGLSALLGICMLTACGGGGGGGGSSTTTPNPAAATNLTAVTVGPGPSNQNNINMPFASITVCQPDGSNCVTIDGLIVDTGSYGIRVMASVLATAGLTLQNTTDPNNSSNTIAECIPLLGGYTWGPLASATIKINGETATNIPINVLNDNGSYTPPVPTACTQATSNTSLSSVSALHANGLLGVGLVPYDCGQSCAQCAAASGGCTASNDIYYSCNASSGVCNPVEVAETAQARNPVTAFAVDNNGVILELPSIPSTGSMVATGSLIFGIGTQSNNSLGSAAVLTVNEIPFISTTFNGQVLNMSFIDSGSNALYFNDSSIATCSQAADFYCPASPVSLQASNQGANGTISAVSFQVDSLDSFSNKNFAFNDLAGTAVTSSGTNMVNNDFDFGLPFFFGRNVFIGIDGANAGGITGPYYAY
jgi:hypothetical protein